MLALPVADRQRVPAAPRRRGAGRRDCGRRAAVSIAPDGATVHPAGVRRRRLSLRPLADPAALPDCSTEGRSAGLPRPHRLRPDRRSARSTGRCCSTSRATRPRSAAKPIDGQLPRSLIELPRAITGDSTTRLTARSRPAISSAARAPDSHRERTSRRCSAPTSSTRARDRPARAYGWAGETPLWLYILRESSARHSGDRLGEVGGRICGEVLYGVIARDPESYRRTRRRLAADAAGPRAAVQTARPARAGVSARVHGGQPLGCPKRR